MRNPPVTGSSPSLPIPNTRSRLPSRWPALTRALGLATLLLLAIIPVHAQVTVLQTLPGVATTSASSPTLATSSTFALNGGNAVALLVTCESASTTPTLSATYAGQAMTLGVATNQGNQWSGIFYLINPTGSSGTFVISSSTNSTGLVYSGLALSNVLNVAGAAGAANTTSSGTVALNYTTSTNWGLVLGACINNGYSSTYPAPTWVSGNANQTTYSSAIVGSSGHLHTYGYVTNAGPNSDTYAYKANTGQRNGYATLAFNPIDVSGPPGSPPPPPNAFGVTDDGTSFVVNSGAGLVFKVNKSNGNVTSWMFNGVEYDDGSGKGSELVSGLGSTGTTVTATNTGNVVKVTLQTDASNTVAANLTHYFIVTNGVNNVYMATYLSQEPGVGEFRWITRLNSTLLPNSPAPSDNVNSTGAIESSDIFGHADGTTTSKYYGDGVTHGKDRALDMTYCGETGTGVGVFMVYDNRESSSCGPFYRDIQNQSGEVYNYLNSGHGKIEAWRTNVLYGPYVLVWNSGSTPVLPIGTSWIGNLALTGWVSASGRGTVSGTASGIQSGIQGVVGLANTTAQYWGKVDGAGNYTITGVKPGTYTATLYQGELEAATSSVTVTAGNTATLNIASTLPNPSKVFQIGDWDGTPQGFMNATNILGLSSPNFISMHPQDVRMDTWADASGHNTFTVGTDPVSIFPSILMRGTNGHTYINFNLTSAQITTLTLKIGSTCTYNGGRPDVKINGADLGYPGAPSDTGTRMWTVGTYRGYNILWTWSIPAADLVVGQNTFDLSAVSGTTDGSPWLSAGWVYDAVELDGPSGGGGNPPAAPTGLTATAGNSQVALSWTASTGATSYNVKRATVSGGPYTTIGTATSASYTDTTAVNGTTYYYVVSAVNTYGESANSSEVNATPSAPVAPNAPTNLAASSPTRRKIALNWTQSSSANITNNKIYRAAVNGGPYTLVTTIAATTTYTDSGLTSGTTYYYVVTAVNSSGLESANSNQASTTSK